eukprot:403345912
MLFVYKNCKLLNQVIRFSPLFKLKSIMRLAKVLALTVVGLIATVGCQDQVEPGTEDQQQPEIIIPGEEYLRAVTGLANSMSSHAIPGGVAANITFALQNLSTYYDSFSGFGQLLNQDQTVGQYLYDTYKTQISKQDDAVFGLVDRNLKTLFEGQDDCYNDFSRGIAEIFLGWSKLWDRITGVNRYGKLEESKDFADFCVRERDNLSSHIDDIADMLLGTEQCDVLQALYNGNVQQNIWTGWRDNIDNNAAYLVMYFTEGVAVFDSCHEVYQQLDADFAADETQQTEHQAQLDQYRTDFQDIVNRILEFDQLALHSIELTLPQNLVQLLDENQDLSLEVMGFNVNGFFLSTIYWDYLMQMGAVFSDASEDAFYSECWQCFTVTQGDYRVTVSWLPVEGTASVTQETLDAIVFDETNSKEDLANQVWLGMGDECVAGVMIFDRSIDHYVNTQFTDQVVFSQPDDVDIIAWGINELCLGRPSLGSTQPVEEQPTVETPTPADTEATTDNNEESSDTQP